MKILPRIKRKLIKRIFGLFSFTTALFVFQACYGVPHDLEYMVSIEGVVKSKTTNLPIPGIEVDPGNDLQKEITDADGKFYTLSYINNDDLSVDPVPFSFKDIDSTNNGSYADKDTIFIPPYGEDPVHFELLLTEKE